jgi:hypothetical protein
MSKQEFLNNLRASRNLFGHPRVQADGPALDPQRLEKMIALAAIWLTPRSVKGFNAEDFRELGSERQQELQDATSEFLRVAQEVSPTEPASPPQLRAARSAFARVLAILEPYLPMPEEGARVEETLRDMHFPSSVVNWDYELGSDQDGGPAVWVNLYVDESIAPRRELGRLVSRITSEIHAALSAAGINRWPYVRVRTVVEYKTAWELATMPLHEDLLNLARELVGRNQTASPVEGDLRRAVSTAYYALFHLLIQEGTSRLVAVATLRPRVSRAFDHKPMRLVRQDYAKLTPNRAGQLVTATGQIVPEALRDVASAFIALQEARQQADYHTDAVITPVQADIDVMSAEVAFLDWQTVQADPAADSFLAELLCRGIPRR